ncbi:16S RNA methylase [Liquorilactobacillus aquaticus DSM 21051]|uniref:16S RNA methylase n=1 Tax=Liquorilactobacillus aquaticus DSM 21051 TaxID=1423725 RepID=A0A0R2CXC8_9LACO|nr:class I SAM-dependent methyltransferase [Liquorilactobacillus aquaticus]KRM95906.1 16S RNA methylase [Liquorilactobacillus aquaticus DSM 21051]
MTNYYYSKNPNVKHDEQTWNFELLGNNFTFITDNGVFSKRTVDFGSRLLIENFEIDEQVQGNVLDVGCGYGPIGLSIAKKYPKRVVDLVDVNELALSLADKNAEKNNIKNVNIKTSDIYQRVEKDDYAVIVSNPPIRAGKKVVHNILEGAYKHLQKDGKIMIVIQKKQGAPSAQKKLEEVFGNCTVVAKEKGYFILKSTKAI